MLLFLLSVPSFAIGFLLPRPELGWPLSFSTAFIALGFMLIGNAGKEILTLIGKKSLCIQSILFVCATVAFAYGTHFRYGEKVLMGMFCFQYGNLFWFFFNAIFGCMAVLMFASILARAHKDQPLGKFRRFIVWLGQHTIGVFLLHLPIVRYFIAPAMSEIGYDRLTFTGAFVDAALALVICCLLTRVIEKYTPILFGLSANPKPRNSGFALAAVMGNTEALQSMEQDDIREILLVFERKWAALPEIPAYEALLLRQFALAATQTQKLKGDSLAAVLAPAADASPRAIGKQDVLKELELLLNP